MSTLYIVPASQPQHVPAGRLLGRMYYGGFLDKVLQRDQRTGYPHNGGEHSLTLHLGLEDLKAFLALVMETFRADEGAADFVASVKTQFAKRYPSVTPAF